MSGARILGLGALLLLGLSGWEAWQLIRIHQWNAAIRRGDSHAAPDAPSRVRFAAAYALRASDPSAALNAFRELEAAPERDVRRDAMFNGATLYLQRALDPAVGADPGATVAWVELAKQSYRELLRESSDDWDARYNLERALRMAPDAEAPPDALPPPPDHRRTPSLAPGLSLGLP